MSLPPLLSCLLLSHPLSFPLTHSVPRVDLLPSLRYFHGQTFATWDSTLLMTSESTVHLVLGCKATADVREEREKNGGWENGKNIVG